MTAHVLADPAVDLGDPGAFKSWAIRQLLTKNYGYLQGAKVVIDGEDTRGFEISDVDYLKRMVNRETPGTIASVKFDDSKRNIGIQLADMIAGAVNRHAPAAAKRKDRRDFESFLHRTHQPGERTGVSSRATRRSSFLLQEARAPEGDCSIYGSR